MHAISAADGRTRWRAETKLALSAGPGGGNGLVVLGTSDGDVVALEAADGRQRWKARVSGEVLSAPLVAGDRVVVRTLDGRMRALAASDGRELWLVEELVPRLSLRGAAAPVVSGDVVICGFDTGKLVAVSLATGEALWQAQVSTPSGRTELERLADVDAAVRVSGDDVYAVGYQGRLVMLSLDSGQVWWGRDVSSYRGLALDDDQIYVSAADGAVIALRAPRRQRRVAAGRAASARARHAGGGRLDGRGRRFRGLSALARSRHRPLRRARATRGYADPRTGRGRPAGSTRSTSTARWSPTEQRRRRSGRRGVTSGRRFRCSPSSRSSGDRTSANRRCSTC